MDPYEATRIVFSRIQYMDPENASKIMGLLLIQDHGEKEMIRLAFGPETLVHSVVVMARKELALNSPTNSSSSPSSPSLLSSSPFSRQSSSSRLGFKVPPLAIPNPASYWNPLADLSKTDDIISPNGNSLNPSSLSFFGNGTPGSDLLDEIPLLYQNHLEAGDAEASAFGWRPCLYYARGFCKNGSNCKFIHGGNGEVDSKMEMMDNCHELLRSKSAQQQRLSHLLSPSSLPYCPKRMKFLLQSDSPKSASNSPVSAMEEFHKYNRVRNDLISPASRQIYLTFPADSTFREEDVSIYFSIYGPVQDVRIPYQPKRMFGFVTFVYAETVKMILAKGNPHFVCDARVLVKPYKEKGKVPEKKQTLEREFESSDAFDLPLGNRMFYNAQDVLWRRKLEEQVDIQQALELQSRRLMSLQLLELKKRAATAGNPIPSPVTHPLEFPTLHASVKPPEKLNEQESLVHNLPDSPFASPTKGSDFFCALSECDNEAADVASFPAFNCQVARFPSGHPVVGGPTCPVGI